MVFRKVNEGVSNGNEAQDTTGVTEMNDKRIADDDVGQVWEHDFQKGERK